MTGYRPPALVTDPEVLAVLVAWIEDRENYGTGPAEIVLERRSQSVAIASWTSDGGVSMDIVPPYVVRRIDEIEQR